MYNKLLPLLLLPTLLFAQQLPLAECQRLAAQGESEALWQLGQRYEDGDGVSKNTVRAIVFYKRAAKKHHLKACERLASLHESGTFVQKNPQKAAYYRALSRGETVVKSAETTLSTTHKQDELEIAIDYLLGRNGKTKDPSTGIRILYANAKKDPVAQRLFIDAWRNGRLDDALTALSEEEWENLYPWFEEAYRGGKKECGLILGNRAFRKGEYDQALTYWQKSNHPNAWFFVGEFYNSECGERFQNVPKQLKNERKAIHAYEQCWKLSNTRNIDAAWILATLYFSTKNESLHNVSRAHVLSTEVYRKFPDDSDVAFLYGVSGAIQIIEYYEMRAQKLKELYTETSHSKNQPNISNYQMSIARLNEDVRQKSKPYLEALSKVDGKLKQTATDFSRALEALPKRLR